MSSGNITPFSSRCESGFPASSPEFSISSLLSDITALVKLVQWLTVSQLKHEKHAQERGGFLPDDMLCCGGFIWIII